MSDDLKEREEFDPDVSMACCPLCDAMTDASRKWCETCGGLVNDKGGTAWTDLVENTYKVLIAPYPQEQLECIREGKEKFERAMILSAVQTTLPKDPATQLQILSEELGLFETKATLHHGLTNTFSAATWIFMRNALLWALYERYGVGDGVA